MNEEQKYLFDVNGFIVIENVRDRSFFTHVHALPLILSARRVSVQLAAWDTCVHAVSAS